MHWELCKKHGMEYTDNWYEHAPPAMIETASMTLKWDCPVYTNNKLKHNRPDITLIKKENNEWTLIDIAVPFDQNILRTESEKTEKYQDLTFEIKREQQCQSGPLGSYTKNVKTWIEKLKILNIIDSTQLSTILQKVLNL